MTKLLIESISGKSLAVAEVKAALGAIGAYDFTEGTIGSRIECSYGDGEDRTIIRLNDSDTVVSIEGSGDASLKAAIELQGRIATSLHVFDTDYTFDLALRNYDSIPKLRGAMNDGLFE